MADLAKREEPQRPKSKTHQFHYKLISVNYIPNTASADLASHEEPQDVVTLSPTLSHHAADTLLQILLLHRLCNYGPNQSGVLNCGLKQHVLDTIEFRATDPYSLSSQCHPGLKQPVLETTEVRATDPNSLSSQRNPGLKQPVLETAKVRATDGDSLSSQHNPGLKQPV